jgi:hypothetical protein
VRGCCEHDHESSESIKTVIFADYLRNYQLLNENSAHGLQEKPIVAQVVSKFANIWKFGYIAPE